MAWCLHFLFGLLVTVKDPHTYLSMRRSWRIWDSKSLNLCILETARDVLIWYRTWKIYFLLITVSSTLNSTKKSLTVLRLFCSKRSFVCCRIFWHLHWLWHLKIRYFKSFKIIFLTLQNFWKKSGVDLSIFAQER